MESRDLEAASRRWCHNPNASSSRMPVENSSHRRGRAGKASARKNDGLLPMPDYGDLGPPPTLAPGMSLLDGSLTALEQKIQPLAGMTSESTKGATDPASTMGLEKDTSSVALLDEDFVRGESIPGLKAGTKLAFGSANVVVASLATAAHSSDEDDLMDDWTVPEDDLMDDWTVPEEDLLDDWTVLEEDTEMAEA